MDHVYRVRNFNDYFETAESRKRVAPMEWIKQPTKHDGSSYRRITQHRKAVSVLCGWWSLLQVAAKMPVRGLLANLDGPLSPEQLQFKTGISKKAFEDAFAVLIDPRIGWLEKLEWDCSVPFVGNLARLGIERQTTADNGRSRQTTADNGRPKTAKNSERSLGRPADNGTHRQVAADNGRSRQTTADGRTEEIREEEITEIPPTVPQGGQEGESDSVGFDDAKSFLHKLFRREKRVWSYEEDQLLASVVPLERRLLPLITAWFELPDSHPVFQATKRKHELTTFLRDFNGEIDKMERHTSLFFTGSAAREKRKEPPLWREVMRWVNDNPALILPETFWGLGRDQQAEYEQNFAAFEASRKQEAAAA